MTSDRLSGIVNILQQDPHAYLAFGPYWWSIKRMLKEHFGPETLYMLHQHDDSVTRKEVESYWEGNEEAILEAACNHYRVQAQDGSMYSGLSTLPATDTPYVLYDADLGPAAAATRQRIAGDQARLGS